VRALELESKICGRTRRGASLPKKARANVTITKKMRSIIERIHDDLKDARMHMRVDMGANLRPALNGIAPKIRRGRT